ncbi:hypothetical protein Rhe02_48260 [Rhizocola hellebori]|uniref:Uncharacterized protein n=1 Tax=Rhizocola hellebori TaxID=1392758 RepID=A0A8J3VGW0_9ACTN|nr:hypothetical protein [Rhizocola hellebori]GIH06759.1 hypothetical protein Rhe02_48260 [Rhizocola hellebori]
MTSTPAYVSRFRIGRAMLGLMAASLALALVILFVGVSDMFLFVLVTVGFTVPAVLLVFFGSAALLRRAGLVVDGEGVHIGGRPPIYRITRGFVPWSAIREIYLFRVNHGVMVLSYVGFLSHDGSLLLKPYLAPSVAKTIWHVPLEAVRASRPAYGWRLDAAAFKAAASHFAPEVIVVDLSDTAVVQAQLRNAG